MSNVDVTTFFWFDNSYMEHTVKKYPILLSESTNKFMNGAYILRIFQKAVFLYIPN